MKTTILSIIATLITFNSLVGNVPTEVVEKEKPTQAKPSLPNGIPPRKPSEEITSKLDTTSFVDFQSKIVELEEKVAELQQSLSTSDTLVTNLKSKISDLETDADSLKSKNESLAEEKNRYYSELQSKNNEISALKMTNKTLSIELDEVSVASNAPIGSIFDGWVYTTDFGWSFVSPDTMPYMYLNDGGWVYYERGSSPRRVFYFDTETWKEFE